MVTLLLLLDLQEVQHQAMMAILSINQYWLVVAVLAVLVVGQAQAVQHHHLDRETLAAAGVAGVAAAVVARVLLVLMEHQTAIKILWAEMAE